jgi:tetratricopeptide (TPR) repeat protein
LRATKQSSWIAAPGFVGLAMTKRTTSTFAAIDGFGPAGGFFAVLRMTNREPHRPLMKLSPLRLFALSLAIVAPLFAAAPVTLTEVDEVIPTYLSGPPDPSPMFYFGRMSQGAEGRTYPYPLYNNLTNRKADQTYHLVYLENEYVKIGIAPEIGGRLFSAVDKTNGYDFVYQQHVIKPALIGLIGAWISGGIEWNIPHHHRASTFLPVQYRTEENADGSKTVWVGELELRHRMRWAVGYTLRPGSSVLECSVRIVNRTPLVNTMLCFANVAVNANDNYQIIFPPSTQWVTHHFKREFTQWPLAKQPYGGVAWNNVDVSWYKNHQAANSMFAWNYSDDFYAGYDHGKQAGTMSIADHHIVPGKKFWTWGNGPRGRMWDDILTDTDGPYIELMVGAYSDNQPDYSWLQPYETRSFEMNWYPFRDIGGVKNATREAAVNVDVKDGAIFYGFYTTREHHNATATLAIAGKTILTETISISPAAPYTKRVELPDGASEQDVRASLLIDGVEQIAYSPVKLTPQPQPETWKPPVAPAEFKSEEELALAGQRIDQFHDPDRDPEPWWEEALKRDPGDSAAHAGLGLRALRAARYAEAETHYRAAIARLTAKYTMPKNAEPFYYLGLTLRGLERDDEAYDAFYKATWSQEWKAPAYYALAEIATTRGDFKTALDLVNRSLDANALNVRAYALKSAILRATEAKSEALAVLALAAQKTDPLDVHLLAEQWLWTKDEKIARELFSTLNHHLATAQELAADYANAGLTIVADEVLTAAMREPGPAKDSPILHYYLADFAEKAGNKAKAAEQRGFAREKSPDYVFPFQAELIPVLRRAIATSPQDARAPYYLGNLLFDWQPTEATALWEKAAFLDPNFPIVWRNLAQAYAHGKAKDGLAKAIDALERATALTEAFPTHFAELDVLYSDANTPVGKRLALLETHESALVEHDECLARLIGLKIFVGKPDEALALLEKHTFNIWEGGTRFSTADSWIDAHLIRGIQRFKAKQFRDALDDFEAATQFPVNLRANDTGTRAAEVAYWVGAAHESLGDMAQARIAWERAITAQINLPRRGGDVALTGENFRRSTQRYYQALAQRKVGETEKADATFRELSVGVSITEPGASASAPMAATTRSRNISASRYASALGYAGLGETEKARAALDAALAETPDLLAAKLLLERL